LKSPMLLWTMIAEESAVRCCTSATRDIKYVTRRFEHEGFSFLTITLPTFGKDLEKGLEQTYVDRNLFKSFSWQAGLPRLFGGFLDLVFDRSSGRLLDNPDIDAILAVRQLTLMYSKILLPCSDAREQEAMAGYVQCEKEVKEADARISSTMWNDFQRVGNLLFESAFTHVDSDIYYGKLLPKHGPGATADKLRGNSKYKQRTWPARLEPLFPYGEYALPNWRYYDNLERVDFLEPGSETPVKVISVPKTLKTPRIIGVEPTAMQYCQQAVLRSILEALRGQNHLDAMLGFRDQTPNQRMAEEGSREGTLATLDLSEASDRVSNQHVRHLVARFPHLHAALDATRSRKAVVPGEGVLRLSKFASMGSALCFPMEAMVFLTMIFLGIEKELNRPLSRHDIYSMVGSVRVYGDDIIVPVDCALSVIAVLESFGIRVNRGKSFWNGKFRESCGKEYYDGCDVSIVKVRREHPVSRTLASEVISLVSLRNQLYFAGYWSTCEKLDNDIRKLLKHFPVVLPTSQILGRHSFLGYTTEWMDKDTHSPMVKGYVVRSVSPKDPLDGDGALTKCLLQLEERTWNESRYSNELPSAIYEYETTSMPTSSSEHLERAGRPLVVALKLKGASPY